jgi:photosystem II stability/assembly factor-like uncharacterized protein
VAATDDGGRSWQALHSFGKHAVDSPFPGAIEFVDAEHGWAAPSGFLYRTTNGGSTWTRQRFQCGFALGGFSFVDARTGFMICGGQPATIDQQKDLYATDDGGLSWHRRACVHTVGPRCQSNLQLGGFASGLAFRDAKTGLLITDRGGIARTHDGGLNWADSLFTDDQYVIVSTSWASPRTVYALIEQDGSVIRSDDAGRHWHSVYPRGPGAPTGPVSFSSATDGIGYSAGRLLRPGGIVATGDGGRTWNRVGRASASDSLDRVTRRVVWSIGTQRLRDGGLRSFLVRPDDNGRHWRRLPAQPGIDAATISFPTARVGYVADVSGGLVRTEDAGKSWHTVRKRGRDLQGAVFFSSRGGLLGGDFGLLGTDDGGRSWRRVAVKPRMTFDELAVLDERRWWLAGFTCREKASGFGKVSCGGKRYLLRTTDGGRSWTAIRFARLPLGASLSFATPRVGYVSGDPRGVYRTTDGGRTWRFLVAR